MSISILLHSKIMCSSNHYSIENELLKIDNEDISGLEKRKSSSYITIPKRINRDKPLDTLKKVLYIPHNQSRFLNSIS
mgnify:CR=1 FL=1